MADEVIVTELTIDSRGAEAGSAAYVKAMKSAQAAYDKAMDSANAATEAVAKQTTVMTGAAGSISSTAKAWDRFKASVDPVFAATQRMERALITADAAAKKLGVDQNEINRVMDLAKTKHLGVAVAVEEGAHASALGATQWASLGHAARSAAESIAMGQSPMMVMTQQANHLSYAMSGPQGIIAASAGVRAAFGTWLTTLPGMLSTAGVAAVGAVALYMAATREDIESVDEILEGHKKLLDEVANTYPHLTEALKKYADEAAKLPGSVIAADAKTRIENDQRSLAASLDHLKVDLRDLQRASDVVGSAGSEAFGKLADTIDAGNVNVDALVASIGDLRLDPSLTPDAKHFAEGIQAAALEAKKLADTLSKDQGIKGLVVDKVRDLPSLFDAAGKEVENFAAHARDADGAIAKIFGGFNVSTQVGSLRSLSGAMSDVAGRFEDIKQATQDARQAQLKSYTDLQVQLQATTSQVRYWQDAIANSSDKRNIQQFFGETSNIKGAGSAIDDATKSVMRLFDQLDNGTQSAKDVFAGIEQIKQALVNDGFNVGPVRKFIESLIYARTESDRLTGDVDKLGRAIKSLPDKTVTITVVTKKVGSGTQSIYDVPGGPVGVTRYGGDPAQQSGPSMTSYSVPTYDSGQGGMVNTGSGSGGGSGVNVTRFATGGIIHPGDNQRVSFFKNTAETVGIFTPGQMSALANPQSGFTGRDPTTENTRYYTVFMNIEANTRKTFNALDDMKTSGAFSSGSGGSSSGSTAGTMTRIGGELYDSNGLNSGGHTAQQVAVFNSVLKSAMSNYSAIGGMGIVGYGASGLAATPQQIAANIAYNGGGGVGIPGANGYEKTLTQTAISMYQQEVRRHKAVYGFATGGIDSRDTQHVEFFKSPGEKVIIARPDQFADVRSGSGSGGGDNRTIVNISQTHNWNGNAPPSKESVADMRRQTVLAVQDAMRAYRGR